MVLWFRVTFYVLFIKTLFLHLELQAKCIHVSVLLLRFLCISKINFVDTDLICLVTAQMSYYSKLTDSFN